jgi:hypothetical protein
MEVIDGDAEAVGWRPERDHVSTRLVAQLLASAASSSASDKADASVSAEQDPAAGVIEDDRAELAHLVGTQEAADAAHAPQVDCGD